MTGEKRPERELLRRRSAVPPPKERFEILLEEIRDDVKTALEGHSVLLGKVDRLDRRMDEHERKQDAQFADIKNFVMTMGRDVNARVDEVNTSLNAKIDGVRAELTEHICALAKDLAEHRADTEGHRSQYRVSE